MNKLYNFQIDTAISNISQSDCIEDIDDIISTFASKYEITINDNVKNHPFLKAASIIACGYTDEDDVNISGLIAFFSSPLCLYKNFNLNTQMITTLSSTNYVPLLKIALAWDQTNSDKWLHEEVTKVLDQILDISVNNQTLKKSDMSKNIFSDEYKQYHPEITKIISSSKLSDMIPFLNNYVNKIDFGKDTCVAEIQTQLKNKNPIICIKTSSPDDCIIISEGSLETESKSKFKQFSCKTYSVTERNTLDIPEIYHTIKFNLPTSDRSQKDNNKTFDDIKNEATVSCDSKSFNDHKSNITVSLSNASNTERAHENFKNICEKASVYDATIESLNALVKTASSSNIVTYMYNIINAIDKTKIDKNLLFKAVIDSIRAIRKLIIDRYSSNQLGEALADIAYIYSAMTILYGGPNGKTAGAYCNYNATLDKDIAPTLFGRDAKPNYQPSIDCSSFVDLCLYTLGIGNGYTRCSSIGNNVWYNKIPFTEGALNAGGKWNGQDTTVYAPGGDTNMVHDTNILVPTTFLERGCIMSWPGHIMIINKVTSNIPTQIIHSAVDVVPKTGQPGVGIPNNDYVAFQVKSCGNYDHKYTKLNPNIKLS